MTISSTGWYSRLKSHRRASTRIRVGESALAKVMVVASLSVLPSVWVSVPVWL